jgi:hypothetical protein
MGASTGLCRHLGDPPRSDPAGSWWPAHKDAVLYPATGVVVGVLGLLWNGTLSMILTPVWMLAGVWVIPSAIQRIVARWRR